MPRFVTIVLAFALVAGVAFVIAIEMLTGGDPPPVNFLDDTGFDASGMV